MLTCALVGCTVGAPKSGFLGDYSGLKKIEPDSEFHARLKTETEAMGLKADAWIAGDNIAQLGQYDKVIVDPVVVEPEEGSEASRISRERLDEIAARIRDTLVSEISERYAVVEQPGENTLRIRTALTDVRPAYIHVPSQDVALLRWSNSYPGGASFESEAVDSVSGKRVVAVIVVADGKSFDTLAEDLDIWFHARQAASSLAMFYRARLDEAHAAK